MNGRSPKTSFRRWKSSCPGALTHWPLIGGLFVGGDGPVGLEAAEVVEANHVVERECAAHARDPPVEAALAQDRPSLYRGLPQRWPVAEK